MEPGGISRDSGHVISGPVLRQNTIPEQQLILPVFHGNRLSTVRGRSRCAVSQNEYL
jgi:hypothetical protein